MSIETGAYQDPVSHWTRRNQRFHPLPELIGYHPGRYTFGHDLDPAPPTMRLESIGYLFTDIFLIIARLAGCRIVIGRIDHVAMRIVVVGTREMHGFHRPTDCAAAHRQQRIGCFVFGE
ncbi:hypothetical protein PD5205_03243 [Xanthomonas fragariae]|uniref:Uncharacterized protein n=1 Tax=Xanthomonas fragariae TaxID=48664 RepID=A0A1Y6GV70_9XANT|nr:hypothetical protein NBC2815_00789 [Xanthomonas fragariae]SMR04521.1 hypothetical protein PD5205_03243 [Xanthomonas fragariae]